MCLFASGIVRRTNRDLSQSGLLVRLLQVCNVGDICGGTAACAWTITRALPQCTHAVWFFSAPTPETRQAFAHCDVRTIARLSESKIVAWQADAVILHNTAAARVEGTLPVSSLLYLHSAGRNFAGTQQQVACSHWLSRQLPSSPPVLTQPVPKPAGTVHRKPDLSREALTIGRFNSPQRKKWPPELLPFYQELAPRFPHVTWEFVGAPHEMQPQLLAACAGRAAFHSANFRARDHLLRWDALLYHHPQLTESFGRTVAEAQRSGCLPIVDRRGGFIEQIEHEQTGWLCENLEEFASAITALSDPFTRWQLRPIAQLAADTRCSLSGFAKRLHLALHPST